MKDKFTITCLPWSLTLFIMVGIVHNWRSAFVFLAVSFVIGTIMENWL